MGKWLAMHTHTKRLPQPSKTYRKPKSYGRNRHGNYIVNPERQTNLALVHLIRKSQSHTKGIQAHQPHTTPPTP